MALAKAGETDVDDAIDLPTIVTAEVRLSPQFH
jgi:hypothetical protein